MELKEEIKIELWKHRSPSKVARNLGISIRKVLEVDQELSGHPRIVREERHDGLGRPELRQFTVARKRAMAVWDASDPKIIAAREAYEAGTHDMATGRDGDWLILYSIPVRKTNPRPSYFKQEC